MKKRIQGLMSTLRAKKGYRKFTSILTAVCVCMSMGIMCFAEETPTFDLTTVATTAAQKIVNDLLLMIAGVAPIMITLMGAAIGITYAINFIKKISGKATS